jgi:hypothetical protein
MRNRLGKDFEPPRVDAASATHELASGTDRLEAAVRYGSERARQFVAAYPVACLVAATAAGIALGWWVKRR